MSESTLKTIVRIVVRVLIAALLLYCVKDGLLDGVESFPSARTSAQRAAALFEMLYGVLSVAALLCIAFARKYLRPVLVAWVIVIMIAGGLATVAWGGLSTTAGIVAGTISGMVGLLLALTISKGFPDKPQRHRGTEISRTTS